MKNLNVSNISPSVGMPLKSGSLKHIQEAYKEALDALAKAVVTRYAPNTVYVLFGLKNSGTPVDCNISSGAVYYNGEIYLVDAAVFTVNANEVAVATISSTYFTDPTADPVAFTDGTSYNIHEIKKAKIQSAFSGSGIADYSQFKRSNSGRVPKGVRLPYRPASGDLSDFNSQGIGVADNVIGWAIDWDLAGKAVMGISLTEQEFSFINQTGGKKSVLLKNSDVPDHQHPLPQSDGSYHNEQPSGSSVYGQVDEGVDVTVEDFTATVGSRYRELSGKNVRRNSSGQPIAQTEVATLQPYITLVYIYEL